MDPYLEAVKRQSLSRRNPSIATQTSKHSSKSHSDQNTKAHKKESLLTEQVELKDSSIFFPEGYEKIFLTLYFLLLPYIAGLIFLFVYIAKGNIDLFYSVLLKQNHILTWCIGYEILAALILLYFAKIALTLKLRSKHDVPTDAVFRRP